MNLLRNFIGKVIIFVDWIFSPQVMMRLPEAQAKVDQESSKLALYQLEGCPFCIKVRRGIKRLGLNIELRDVKKGSPFRDELLQKGGKIQAPCLRITKDGGQSDQWMYESSDILEYLQENYS